MANITGTQHPDTLTGTAGNDTIKGLGGNDRIIVSDGSDTIDGGAGYDTIDYSSIDNLGIAISATGSISASKIGDVYNGSDSIQNIERIVAKNFNSAVGVGKLPQDTKLEVDLSKNLLRYSSASIGTKTLKIENFSYISSSTNHSRLKGNDSDNIIDTNNSKTNSFILGSKGNDNLNTDDTDTIDYSKLGHAVSFLPKVVAVPIKGGVYNFFNFNVDKGSFGRDPITNFKTLIGANNQLNTIDASSADNSFASLDVNLAKNSLKLNSFSPARFRGSADDPVSSVHFEVVNFANVVGSKYNDTVVGAHKNSKLTGGGGNDNITGGNKNDRITGTDSTARGVGECDTLTGGGGRDKFILGDNNGAYYVGKGKDDYATITDFDLFKDSICIGSLKDYSFALQGTNEIDLYSGKDVKTRDLIAKIHITSGISAVNNKARSAMGVSSSLDQIVAKIDILSAAQADHG
jgi:Ca2+-binding RTX toxin-like protein